MSPDTIVPNPANPQSFNRYSYVRNNPVNLTDPTGHAECGSPWEPACAGGSSSAPSATPTPTPYPTPTSTSVSTPTSTPSPTSTPTFTPTPMPTSTPITPTPWPTPTPYQTVQYSDDPTFNKTRPLGSRVVSALSWLIPDFKDSDALSIGFAANADFGIPFIVNLGGAAGYELVINWNSGEVGLFAMAGGGPNFGEGANGAIYIAEINNLENNASYQGLFRTDDLTLSVLQYGATRGTFGSPGYQNDPTLTNGQFIGYAPGANFSSSHNFMYYTPPIINYNWSTQSLEIGVDQ